MAQHARLEKACLVVEGRRSRRPAETGLGVALQAQQVYIAQLQHVRIRSAMHQVAGLAAVNLYGLVLEYKRPLLVRMACEADRILRGRGSHLLGPHCAVRIMAVSTLDEPFVHSMMERHVEFGLLRQVARITKLGLRLHQHEMESLPWCGEWQETQLTSFLACSELIAFMCCVPPAWQPRQRASISFAEVFSKRKSLDVSVGSATWLAAAPWQSSQPCLAIPPSLYVCFQCELFSQPL